MKKFLAASALVAFLVSSSFAKGFFISPEIGYFDVDEKYEVTNTVLGISGNPRSITQSMSVPNYSISLGYIFSPNHRISASYGRLNYGPTFKTTLGYDFTPQIYNSLRGDLGIYGGYAKLKSSVLDGGVGGLKAGFIVGNEHTEINFGVKIEAVAFQDLKTEYGLNISTLEKRNLESAGFYLALVFKF